MLALVSGCEHGTQEPATVAVSARAAAHPAFARTASEQASRCQACHPEAYAAWVGSQHARASEPVQATLPAGLDGDVVGWIGVTPLRQPILRGERGRLVAGDVAIDVRDGSTFALTGATAEALVHDRTRTWDTQCASCHMTGLRVRFDPAADRYDTTAEAAGVSCLACHTDHTAGASPPSAGSTARTERCAECHARREPLQADDEPMRALRTGQAWMEALADRARLELADAPGLFHADGQAADEVFEANSLALSAMGAAGVICGDCHEPHGGGLRRSASKDGVCLQCHGADAEHPLATQAPDIVPAAHTHHAPESEGARCVSCHMPARTYMVRDSRRDHGFTVPDPALAARIGAPDACTGCHTDRTQAAAAAELGRWWPEMARSRAHARKRAEAVHLARSGDPTADARLLAALAQEPNPAWQATLLGLVGEDSPPLTPAVQRRAAESLRSPSSAVRAAAVRLLAQDPRATGLLTALREQDTSRLVRLAAAWATRTTLPTSGKRRAEVEHWLFASADQPAGARRLAGLRIEDGRAREGVAWAERAMAWEPSPESQRALERALAAAGRTVATERKGTP